MLYNPYYSSPSLTKEEEYDLFILYNKSKSLKTRDKILESNYKLLLSIIRRFKNIYSIDSRELFQEGFIGLCKAIEKFKPESGYKFSTYATNWVKIYIYSFIKNSIRTVKITEYANSQVLRYKKEKDKNKLFDEWGSFKFNQIKLLFEMKSEIIDYEKPTDELREDLRSEDLCKFINKIIKNFPAKEKVILRCRFTLNKGKKKTLEEIGYPFGITKERIRQVEKKALEKFKFYLKKHKVYCIGDLDAF